MKKFTQPIILVVFSINLFAQHGDHVAPTSTAPIRLLEPSGFAHKKVSTTNIEAQKYFDQGLTLLYAYNSWDAARSFKRAAELDPSLAMAWWGVAEATFTKNTWRPDYAERMKEFRAAISKAVAMKAPPTERIYIEATAKLFSDAEKPDYKSLEAAYSAAMKRIYEDSNNDPDAATLYLFTTGWSWTKDGKPLGETSKTVEILERELKRSPMHLGLNHLYIHVVEASSHPERTSRSADILRSFKLSEPELGHLVHMPAHIYVRVGDFQKAAESNQETAKMVTANMTNEFKEWHFGHVFSFLRLSYYMQGNYEKLRANDLVSFDYFFPNPTPDELKRRGNDIASMVRFRRWSDVLKFQHPEKPVPNMSYHRARALAATGKIAEAEIEQNKYFEACKCGPDFPVQEGVDEDTKKMMMININRLAAKIASAKGDNDRALEHLKKAVAIEDEIPYSEPPISIEPARLNLGGLLLRMGRFKDAEKAFRDDLLRNRGNGRSLFGLMKAFEGQNKPEEAQKARRAFNDAWKYADTELTIEEL